MAEPHALVALVEEIIAAYHTTRLSSAMVAEHILSKPSVKKALLALTPTGTGEAAGPWNLIKTKHPPKDTQVLIRLREGVGGFVCDVACYIGQVKTELGVEDRWILSDIRLESKQIHSWAEILPPEGKP